MSAPTAHSTGTALPSPSRLERALRYLMHRDPAHGTAWSMLRVDIPLAVLVVLIEWELVFTIAGQGGHRPDALGWTLLVLGAVPVAFRRLSPMAATIAVVCFIGPYHLLDNHHLAVVPTGFVVIYTLSSLGPPLRSFLTVATVIATMIGFILISEPDRAVEMLLSSGWVMVVVLLGWAVRTHRREIAAIVERAERAERTREEEAARRVAEERLRIARDLHDLLAHSITLIGVQTSVAAHILVADPERLDREAVAEALDTIADTCRDARAELRTTLQVLRTGQDTDPRDGADTDGRGGDDGGETGPLPSLATLPDLARTAESGGAHVDLAVRLDDGDAAPPPVPAAVGAAAYRIVQEALTNAVRHAGPEVSVRVVVDRDESDDALRVAVRNLGPGGADTAGPGAAAGGGFGIMGMRERARSVGGSLDAGPSADGGFTVTAVLPITDHPAPRRTVAVGGGSDDR